MPVPSDFAVLGILGVEVPMGVIRRPEGAEEAPPPEGQQDTPCPVSACPPHPLAGVDPDLLEELLEAELDHHLFEEDW